jgi:hypothetical protein
MNPFAWLLLLGSALYAGGALLGGAELSRLFIVASLTLVLSWLPRARDVSLAEAGEPMLDRILRRMNPSMQTAPSPRDVRLANWIHVAALCAFVCLAIASSFDDRLLASVSAKRLGDVAFPQVVIAIGGAIACLGGIFDARLRWDDARRAHELGVMLQVHLGGPAARSDSDEGS